MRASLSAELDRQDAKREADWAGSADADDAVDFAAAAIKEAEYAVLNAQLARMNADAMAAAS